MQIIEKNKVRVSREEAAQFCASWPCCKLRDRSYWFEFAENGDLIDTDLPQRDDGPEATALSEDAYVFLTEGE